MTIQITTETIFSISIGALNGNVEVNAAMFSPAVSAYVFEYGLKQMLNDCHASVTASVEPDDAKRAEAKLAMVQKKLDSLYAGHTVQARTGGTSDPRTKLIRQFAEQELQEGIKKAGKKVADVKKQVDAQGNGVYLTAILRLIDKHEDRYIKAADAALKARGAASTELDLGELGL